MMGTGSHELKPLKPGPFCAVSLQYFVSDRMLAGRAVQTHTILGSDSSLDPPPTIQQEASQD